MKTFEEIEEKKDISLKIGIKGEKTLSKNQQAFNKLTKRIENLEKEIVSENERLSKLAELHGKDIIPLRYKAAHIRIQLAMTLAKTTQLNKYGKNQIKNIKKVILSLCDNAFSQIEPTPEQEAFYDQWSEVPYKEELDQQTSESKEMFSDFMSEMFGFDINMEDFDESPEGFTRLQEEMREKFEQSQQNSQQQKRKKTKKQQEKEENKKLEEDIKNKSIRSIYIALAKVLHPDAEGDTSLKLEKEEIMKKVTVAYDQKDLATLLKLEMEWVYNTAEHLEQLTDEKLKIYISSLKQQVAELESEKCGLYYSPRYAQISAFIHLPEKLAINQIKKQKKELKGILEEINSLITTFERPNSKKLVTEFVTDFCREEEDEFDDYLDDMFPIGF